MYKELQWRFSKVQSYSDVFQIAKNYDGTYPINPKLIRRTPTLPDKFIF
jgi:hypothetical protein